MSADRASQSRQKPAPAAATGQAGKLESLPVPQPPAEGNHEVIQFTTPNGTEVSIRTPAWRKG